MQQQQLESIKAVIESFTNNSLENVKFFGHVSPAAILLQQQQVKPFATPDQQESVVHTSYSPVSMLVQRMSTEESKFFGSDGTIFNNSHQTLYLACLPCDTMPRAGLTVKFVPSGKPADATRDFSQVSLVHGKANEFPYLQVVFDTKLQSQDEEEGTIAVYWQNIKCSNDLFVKFTTYKEKKSFLKKADQQEQQVEIKEAPVSSLDAIVSKKDLYQRNALFYCYFNGWNDAAKVLQEQYGLNAQERDVFGYTALDMISKRDADIKRLSNSAL